MHLCTCSAQKDENTNSSMKIQMSMVEKNKPVLQATNEKKFHFLVTLFEKCPTFYLPLGFPPWQGAPQKPEQQCATLTLTSLNTEHTAGPRWTYVQLNTNHQYLFWAIALIFTQGLKCFKHLGGFFLSHFETYFCIKKNFPVEKSKKKYKKAMKISWNPFAQKTATIDILGYIPSHFSLCICPF